MSESHSSSLAARIVELDCGSNIFSDVQILLSLDGGPLPLLSDQVSLRKGSVHDQTLPNKKTSRTSTSQQIWVRTEDEFLDKMIYTFAKHAGWSLRLRVNHKHPPHELWGYIGEAVREALLPKERKGIARFGEAHVPAERALSRAVVDIKALRDGDFAGTFEFGDIWPEELYDRDIPRCMRRFCFMACIHVHVDILRVHVDNRSDRSAREYTAHYTAKAAFKSFAVAFKRAAARVPEKERDVIISQCHKATSGEVATATPKE